MPEMITRAHLVRQLLDMGAARRGAGGPHRLFQRCGRWKAWPEGLIAALREALGPAGTLVMPGMTEDDDHPFDPRQTPCSWPGRGRRYLLADAGRAALQQPAFPAAGAQAA